MDKNKGIKREPRYKAWKGKRRMAMVRHALIPVAVLAAVIILYGMIASRYYQLFLPGTKINGLDVSGMSVSRAEELLKEAGAGDYVLEVIFRGDQSETVTGSQIDLTVSFSGEVSGVLDDQDPFTWLPRLLGRDGQDLSIRGMRIYDTGKLADWLSSLPELQDENMEAPVDACMELGEDDLLTVHPESIGTQLQEEILLNAVENAAANGDTSLRAEDVEDAYAKPAVTSTNAILLEQIDRANAYLSAAVTYTLYGGSTVTVDASMMKEWLTEQENQPGWYYMDLEVLRSRTEEYANYLADQYNAYYDYYDFQSTSYGTLSIRVSSGSYGYIVNRTAEAEALYQNIVNGEVTTRVPVYSVATPLDNGISGTYIEVDTYAQKVYLYEDGVNTFTTDCVTGLATDPERVTPSGLYTLYDKERDRTLQGTVEEETGLPEYMSAVSYWMPFSGGYGLHDASWRSVFGSTIYQTQGSHGCVNLPIAAAAKIYDAVEVGTPVIVI